MIGMRKTVVSLVLTLVVIFLFALTPISHADGGVVMCQRVSTPFDITLFVNEMPLRPGPADLSVLVERTNEHSAILDAHVFIELEHQTGAMIHAEATRSQARNKLLYCSLINLPLAGQWKMRVHVKHGDEVADILSDLVVATASPVLVSYWQLFALPLFTIILFLINQWLRRRQLRSHLRNRGHYQESPLGGSSPLLG
jgi:hypothetical protein